MVLRIAWDEPPLQHPMWETTLARNSHAGLGKDFTIKDHTKEYVRFVKWLTKSGVAISRKCCFPHGSHQRKSTSKTRISS